MKAPTIKKTISYLTLWIIRNIIQLLNCLLSQNCRAMRTLLVLFSAITFTFTQSINYDSIFCNSFINVRTEASIKFMYQTVRFCFLFYFK